MEALFTIENLITLGMLIMLQAVLGFDNLLYISLESKRVAESQQGKVRKIGIGVAMLLRIVLLFVLVSVIDSFQDPIFSIHIGDLFHSQFNVHSIIVLAGGVFIIYTAVKEIWHMMIIHHLDAEKKDPASTQTVITMIVLMNLVFSFDSILSAMALTNNFYVMALAIVIGGLLMIWLSDRVSTFLKKNRMYEVLGLFILFIVGIMLLSEGGHLAHLQFFGYDITPMSKATFYFVIFTLIVVDIVQGRYQKKLLAMKEKEEQRAITQAS